MNKLKMEREIQAVEKIGYLKPRSRSANLTVKLLQKGEVREIESRRDGSKHRVSEVTVGDGTGTVLMTLWDDMIDKVEEGKIYDIKNGYTTLFKGNIRLNIGRYGELNESDKMLEEINEGNNISEKHYEDYRRGGRRRFEGRGPGRERMGEERGEREESGYSEDTVEDNTEVSGEE